MQGGKECLLFDPIYNDKFQNFKCEIYIAKLYFHFSVPRGTDINKVSCSEKYIYYELSAV